MTSFLYFSKNFSLKRNRGFTLIELLVVIAVIGVLATIVALGLDPLTQLKKARDMQRKKDITSIAKALDNYYAVMQNYPVENYCDSSIGTYGAADCPVPIPQPDWNSTSPLHKNLVSIGELKDLPIDPVNNNTYYYLYEPDSNTQNGCVSADNVTYCAYWIGGKLEKPTLSNGYFRCTNKISVGQSNWGCKEVSGRWN